MIVQSFPNDKRQLFLETFTRSLAAIPQFDIIHVDSNWTAPLIEGLLDSALVAESTERGADGIVFSQFFEENDSQFVAIRTVFSDSQFKTLNYQARFTFGNYNAGVNDLARHINSRLSDKEDQQSSIRILLILPEEETDSDKDAIAKILADAADRSFRIEIINGPADDFPALLDSDSLLRRAAKDANAWFVFTGTFQQQAKEERTFTPIFFRAGQEPEHASFWNESNAIKGNTCQLARMTLPPLSLAELTPATGFLTAYFALHHGDHERAIRLLSENDFYAGAFLLAESYLSRGIEREKDVAFARADWDSAAFHLKRCLRFPIGCVDSVFLSNNLGVAYQLIGQLDSALVQYTSAHARVHCLNNPTDRLRVSGNFGNILLLSGKWKQALDTFQASVEDMKTANDSLTLALTYENLGNIYQLIMQRSRAVQFYTQALELRQAMHDDAGAAMTLSYLGNTYHELENYPAARSFFLKGLNLHQQCHNEPGIADTYDRLGQVYQKLGQPDSSEFYYQQSIMAMTELDNNSGLVRTMLHLASAYSLRKEFDHAMELYERALPIATGSEIKSLSAQIYDRMGDIHNNKNELMEAFDNYDQAAELYEQAGNLESLSLILYSMGLIRLKQNDYGEGYALMKRAIDLDDSHGFNNLSGEREFLKELQLILEGAPNN
ncbi:MAG: tetratricopeptide repeat protein [Candidatus Zhuqueibacterota bacterium]